MTSAHINLPQFWNLICILESTFQTVNSILHVSYIHNTQPLYWRQLGVQAAFGRRLIMDRCEARVMNNKFIIATVDSLDTLQSYPSNLFNLNIWSISSVSEEASLSLKHDILLFCKLSFTSYQAQGIECFTISSIIW